LAAREAQQKKSRDEAQKGSGPEEKETEFSFYKVWDKTETTSRSRERERLVLLF